MPRRFWTQEKINALVILETRSHVPGYKRRDWEYALACSPEERKILGGLTGTQCSHAWSDISRVLKGKCSDCLSPLDDGGHTLCPACRDKMSQGKREMKGIMQEERYSLDYLITHKKRAIRYLTRRCTPGTATALYEKLFTGRYVTRKIILEEEWE